ncbi:diguanylate cyclase [Paenibacillus gorillae]|uniref:sensor domain-containing diguanylate cyclase n=1 Tax=Paenibacillus gorillae TaxID=1243662 RepID=UPI0004B3B019|nr:sensor domain-containing diguanylate cyclase [Paenibacillus gorillae]
MDIQLDKAPCGYFSISDSGSILTINQTLLDMLLYERHELLGRHIESVMSVTNKLFFHTYFYPYIQMHGHVNEMYISLRTNAQQDLPVLLNGVRQQRDGETVIDCVAVVMRKRIEHERDILHSKTKLEELYQATNEANQKLEILHEEYELKQQELIRINLQLETMAATDPLTGLHNRRFFQVSLLTQLLSFRETGEPFSLLIIDIDHFKRINDTFGHPAGDAVLVHLARLLESMAREPDIIARFGGEEFVVILPGTDQDDAILTAEKYRSAIASSSCGEHTITVSIGASTVCHGDTDETLLHQADTALYASKSSGRDRVTHSKQLVAAQD